MTNQSESDSGIREAMSHRRRLINLAYRMLGSLADAEDAVQETYARWYALSPRSSGTRSSRPAPG